MSIFLQTTKPFLGVWTQNFCALNNYSKMAWGKVIPRYHDLDSVVFLSPGGLSDITYMYMYRKEHFSLYSTNLFHAAVL